VRFARASGLQPIVELAIAPGGRLAAVRGERAGVALLDLETGAWLGRLPRSAGRAMRFVGARELVTAGDALTRWRLDGLAPSALDAGGGVTSVDVRGPVGRPVVAFAADQAIETGPLDARARVALAHAVTMKSLALDPDGAGLVAVASGFDGITRLDAERLVAVGAVARARRVGRLEGAGASWLVVLPYDGPLRAVRADGGEEVVVVGPGGALGEHHDLSVSPGHGHAAVLAVAEGRVRRLAWAPDGVVVDREAALDDARAVALERGGDLLWLARGEGLTRVSFAEPEGATVVAEVATPGVDWVDLAVSDVGPRGVWVAAGDRVGATWLWRADEDGVALVARLDDHEGRVAALAFAPDGSFLATGSWDRTVRLRALAEEPAAPEVYERAWGVTLAVALGRGDVGAALPGGLGASGGR
ncbi:MAG: hypothetical protein KC635_18875, partial [Myxococcales bacterium]|nr:hypothetical protein [Myxococcales bacterium]